MTNETMDDDEIAFSGQLKIDAALACGAGFLVTIPKMARSRQRSKWSSSARILTPRSSSRLRARPGAYWMAGAG
jgi:hypothetical protein